MPAVLQSTTFLLRINEPVKLQKYYDIEFLYSLFSVNGIKETQSKVTIIKFNLPLIRI